MRDPQRRERILTLIRDVWMKPENADLRLYQLLGNVTDSHRDPYYIEDATVEAGLRRRAERQAVPPVYFTAVGCSELIPFRNDRPSDQAE